MKLKVSFITALMAVTVAKNVVSVPKLDKRQEQEFLEQQLFQTSNEMLVIPEGMGISTTIHNALLSTFINNHLELSIFSMYVREDVPITQRMDNPKKATLIFAPLNSAIEQLAAKPWEFPQRVDESEAATDKEIDDLVASNVGNFVESHIVTDAWDFSPLGESEALALRIIEVQTINGKTLRLKNVADGGFQVAPGNGDFVDILEIQVVENGVVLLIPETLSKPE